MFRQFFNPDNGAGDGGKAPDASTVKIDVSDALSQIDEANKLKVENVNVKDVENKVKLKEQERISEIYAIAEKHNARELAQEYIKKGSEPSEFGLAVLERSGDYKKIDEKKGEIGLSDKDARNFSIVRAIRGLASKDMSEIAPFELECSRAVESKTGKIAQGFFIPDDVLSRTLTVGTVSSPGTGAGNTVAQELLSSSFIDLLYNRMVIKQAGARILDGLVGDILIPKMTGGATTYWVGEDTAITAASAQTFAQVSMAPKTVGAYTDLSRKLLLQSSVGIEAMIRDDMATQIALAIDKAALMGTGAPAAIPTGVLNTSGIGTVDSGGVVPDYADLIALWSDVAVENAAIGNLGYIFNSKMAGALKQVFPNTTGGDVPVYQGDIMNGNILGLKCHVTNQIPNTFTSASISTGGALTAIIFGNWNDLIIGQWSGIDVTIDPYSNSTKGTLRIVLLQDVDVAVRHVESFSATQNAATA
jgi:HK97 family phage major capsid protein